MTETEINKLFETIDAKEMEQPFILPRKTKKHVTLVKYKTQVLQSSVKKAKPFARLVIGKSYYEALYILSNHIQKVPKFLLQALNRSISTLTKRNLNPAFVYIQGIITCQNHSQKKIRFHGKAKMGIQKRNFIDFRILFGRRDIKEFFKDLVTGKNHIHIVSLMKSLLKDKDAGYESINALNWIMTSKGRQQKKLMIKRRALNRFVEHRKFNVYVPLKRLFEDEVEKEAVEFMQNWGFLFDDKPNIRDDFRNRLE